MAKTLFNPEQLKQALAPHPFIWFESLDSTNEYLIKHAHQYPAQTVVIANEQTAGRGRRGHQWYSPKQQNLYYSYLYKFPLNKFDNQRYSSLSLVVALVVAQSLEALGVKNVGIKWPNDIYINGRKMGGILIETKRTQQAVALVIGIGLNLYMNAQKSDSHIGQPWISLDEVLPSFDANQLVVAITHQLNLTLTQLSSESLVQKLALWPNYDEFYQQSVRLICEKDEFMGINLGINDSGEIGIQTADKKIQYFAIGELSLRAIKD